MNCQAVQNKILALPDPRRVPDPLRAHVAGCGACLAWARQAARLESLLEQLPVPTAGERKDALIEELTRQPAAAEPARPVVPFLRRNAALVGGLAAAVLVAGGWWMFGGSNGNGGNPVVAAPPTPEHPLLKKLVQRDVALAKADTPAKRLQALGGLADDLSAETRNLARVATPTELQDLARWYGKVKDGIVRQADKLPPLAMSPAERKAHFEALAGKLGETAADVDRLAGQVPPEAKPALQKIADAARDGQKKLTVLATKGS